MVSESAAKPLTDGKSLKIAVPREENAFPNSNKTHLAPSFMVKIATFLIKCYQVVSHSIFPRTCRFHPSCSQYALEAITKYGVMRGTLKAMGRILRCSPLSHGGYDPVK